MRSSLTIWLCSPLQDLPCALISGLVWSCLWIPVIFLMTVFGCRPVPSCNISFRYQPSAILSGLPSKSEHVEMGTGKKLWFGAGENQVNGFTVEYGLTHMTRWPQFLGISWWNGLLPFLRTVLCSLSRLIAVRCKPFSFSLLIRACSWPPSIQSSSHTHKKKAMSRMKGTRTHSSATVAFGICLFSLKLRLPFVMPKPHVPILATYGFFQSPPPSF
jgi:hypothetical protein